MNFVRKKGKKMKNGMENKFLEKRKFRFRMKKKRILKNDSNLF